MPLGVCWRTTLSKTVFPSPRSPKIATGVGALRRITRSQASWIEASSASRPTSAGGVAPGAGAKGFSWMADIGIFVTMTDLTEPDKARHQAAAVDDLVAALRRATSVFVLTGSGISAQSGLPTFRGVGGLWRTHRVEELASPQGFAHDPRLVWTWYNERRAAHERAQPNAGHRALAAMEHRIGDFTLATQNVDSLHLRAGSSNVLELHGKLREARCTGCEERR